MKSTRGGIDAEFPVTKEEFERARNLSLLVQGIKCGGDGDWVVEGEVPRDVYIVVKFCNV